MAQPLDLASIPTHLARWYQPANRTAPAIRVIVLHSMEAPEKGDTAEAVARYFASLPSTKKASTHYNVDSDSVVRSVPDKDIAYHVAGFNTPSLGIEHAGYARQTPADWADPYSSSMLGLSARLTAALCARYSIPPVYLSESDLRAGRRGITTHATVSRAFGVSDHWDPGPGFPIDLYISLVTDAGPNPPSPTPTPAPPGGVPMANAPFVALLVHPAGGYLQIGEDGGVFAWGGAPFYGSLGGIALAAPIVDAKWAPDRLGYYLLGRDGGIFAFGSARHQGNALYRALAASRALVARLAAKASPSSPRRHKVLEASALPAGITADPYGPPGPNPGPNTPTP